MEMFVSKDIHSGNPQDEGYNKIQAGYPFDHLKNEADYILEEQEDGVFKLTKKPDTCTLVQVDDCRAFLATGVEKVLVVYADGRYDRFNFDYKSQFPMKDEPDTNAAGTPDPAVDPAPENGEETA